MSRICLNEYTSVFRQAGRLIFCSTFACLPLREFSHGFKSFRFCYEQRNARVIPLRKEGQSSAFFSRGCPIHLPPVTGHPHALRRDSSFRQSCALPQPSGGLPAHEAWHRLARSASSQGAGPSFFSGLPRGSSHPPTVDGCSCSSQKQPQEASEFIRMEECGKPLSSDLFGCPR